MSNANEKILFMGESKNNFRDRKALEHVKAVELRCKAQASGGFKEGFDCADERFLLKEINYWLAESRGYAEAGMKWEAELAMKQARRLQGDG